jgi:hypothetical protein
MFEFKTSAITLEGMKMWPVKMTGEVKMTGQDSRGEFCGSVSVDRPLF